MRTPRGRKMVASRAPSGPVSGTRARLRPMVAMMPPQPAPSVPPVRGPSTAASRREAGAWRNTRVRPPYSSCCSKQEYVRLSSVYSSIQYFWKAAPADLL